MMCATCCSGVNSGEVWAHYEQLHCGAIPNRVAVGWVEPFQSIDICVGSLSHPVGN